MNRDETILIIDDDRALQESCRQVFAGTNYTIESAFDGESGLDKYEILKPDLVLMPCLHDIHQDHSTVAAEGLRAFKDRTVLGYELIWNNLSFNTDCFVRLEERHIEKKAEALSEYASQSGKTYMSNEFVFSLARTRGVQIGAEFAECFEVVRWVI